MKLSKVLPKYYRLYPGDLRALSRAIKPLMKSANASYQFCFGYLKLGQQFRLASLASFDCSFAVKNPNKVESASIHLAFNFQMDDPRYLPFWDRAQTRSFLGRSRSYPLLGLGELGNVTSNRPYFHLCEDISVPFAQAYTPFVKPLEDNVYPFLISHLLGGDYVRSSPKFRYLVECTDHLKEYR